MHVLDKTLNHTRRFLTVSLPALLAAVSLAILASTVASAASPATGQKADVTVYKTAFCSCCNEWVAQLTENGLTVDVNIVAETNSIRTKLGVPRQLASCHTAIVGNYWVEGHVPVDLVTQLLQEPPANIKGIAVPGMVAGSPGMEAPNPQAYRVLSVDDHGAISNYATRMGRSH